MKGRDRRSARLGKVCTTISANSAERMVQKAGTAFALGTDLVELRLDLLDEPGRGVLSKLAPLAGRSIITVRRKEEGGGYAASERERLALITEACGLRPQYIDVELITAQANPGWYEALPKRAQKIVSWHDFRGTPAFSTLRSARRRAASLGEITKIVTAAKTEDDNLKVLRLYEEEPSALIAFCMGPAGSVSRLAGLLLGSPITYASLPGEPVAPGQLPVTAVLGLRKILERAS